MTSIKNEFSDLEGNKVPTWKESDFCYIYDIGDDLTIDYRHKFERGHEYLNGAILTSNGDMNWSTFVKADMLEERVNNIRLSGGDPDVTLEVIGEMNIRIQESPESDLIANPSTNLE